MEVAGTLIDTAYDYLRNQLIIGEVLPGTMLSENELALQLGMSRTPVRLAISRLESEGVVQSLKKRGVLVKSISWQESSELAEVILAMQFYATAIIEREGFKELDQLRAIYARQLAATEQEDYVAYIQHSMEFTTCFVSVLRNRSMLEALDKHQSKTMLFGIMNYRMTPHAPHFSATPHNGSILKALENNDCEALKNVLFAFSSRIREGRSFY
ncbi:DNA-binding GntR family transcriptional regulator [Paenibacillus phyllosphaerae]|uniref:DNA-binding GntR family transcriptional regulator n=1 Tax=Paenibacillus phyllosphaerae TaxID=274593 RepID=A0A7W5FQY7_9BACL|nr:GntR family transcriptional regulator [Paenibacillus phyllosphaerae]MBB3113950.1 DNA-binding GntR family transcriptional regulator [Paenibacillus phyllosphaerae]